MQIGKILQMCRWEKGLSQRGLEEISGVSRTTIGSIETNARGASVTVFAELLQAMGYELAVVEKQDGKQAQKYRAVKAVVD